MAVISIKIKRKKSDMRYLKKIGFLLLLPSILWGQKFTWNTQFYSFFDNTEFAGSSYTIDQTMAGVSLAQFAGVKIDDKNSINAGVDVVKRLGSHKVIDDYHWMAFFQYVDKNTQFYAGSFHRQDLLEDYSSFFFQDSVNYYHRVMEGLFLKKGDENQFFKLWLDWTGLQTDSARESFFVGASGYKSFARNFHVDFQTYLFHYAGTRPVIPAYHVCDNFLTQASVGYHYKNNNGLNNLLISGGVLVGFERNRKYMNNYSVPVGFVGKADVEYKQFGMENLVYAGQPRMTMYSELGNAFYWGNPFLRGNFYWQNKLYWNAFHSEKVQGQLAWRTHFSEGKAKIEQLFILTASIGK